MRKMFRLALLAILLIGMIPVLNAQDTVWRINSRITAIDGFQGASFGRSVALDSTTMLVGARGDNTNGANSGSVYVFEFDGSKWVQEAKLLPDDGASGDSFGWLVRLDGDTALVGAPGEDGDGTDQGAAYVFVKDGDLWSQQAKLVADTPRDGARLGVSIAIEGDQVLVGADAGDEEDTGFGTESFELTADPALRGRVFYFTRSNSVWTLDSEITPNDGADNDGDQFGWTLDYANDRAIIGAPYDNNDAGSAYIFDLNQGSWSQTEKITAEADAAPDDNFGFSVSLNGDEVAVGAFGDDAKSGSVFLFTLNGTWGRTQKIEASDKLPNNQFGFPVLLTDQLLIVGSTGRDANQGASYVYNFNGTSGLWEQDQILTDTNGNDGDLFGITVAVGVDQLLIGAERAGDTNGQNRTGRVYDWTNQPIVYGTDTIGVYNFTSGNWYLRNSVNNGPPNVPQFTYGKGNLPVAGDWDGDGIDTIGVYNEITGRWYLRNSNDSGSPNIDIFAFGRQNLPVTGDWNGDGVDTIGVYNEITGNWYLRDSNDSGSVSYPSFTFGRGNLPVAGDWNGDGVDTIGVYNFQTGRWYLRDDNSGGAVTVDIFAFGRQNLPVVGDWNRDGTDTIGVYRPDTGNWYLRDSNDSGSVTYPSFTYGRQNLPITGDWDGPEAGLTSLGVPTQIAAISVYNTETATAINLIGDGTVLKLADLPESVAIVAEAYGGTGVVFDYQGVSEFRTDTEAPYTLTGETDGEMNPVALSPGTHNLTATLVDEAGLPLDQLSLTFIVE